MTLGVMALADGSATQADRSTNTPGSASGSGKATTATSEEVPVEAPSAPKKTVAEALELLNSLRPEITEIINDSGNISVPLTGLNIMNDRPEEAYVLWAGPGTNNDGSSLWRISPFSFAEILRRVAVQPELAGIQRNGKSSVTPDDAASEADFGTYGVDEIHLWKMGSWDEEKRYVSLGHISLG
ncbi:hypothetical protein FRC04_008960 [Tulasnella sp. 424]|nr:hypothetical protein FRC04_008960 [Tulasnella sp. 424]